MRECGHCARVQRARMRRRTAGWLQAALLGWALLAAEAADLPASNEGEGGRARVSFHEALL